MFYIDFLRSETSFKNFGCEGAKLPITEGKIKAGKGQEPGRFIAGEVISDCPYFRRFLRFFSQRLHPNTGTAHTIKGRSRGMIFSDRFTGQWRLEELDRRRHPNDNQLFLEDIACPAQADQRWDRKMPRKPTF